MAVNLVSFIASTAAKYNGLASKDASTLYFLEDVKKIYKGDIDVTEAIRVVAAFGETPDDTIVEGKIYINATTFEARIRSGNSWIVMMPGYIGAEDGFVDANGDKLATIAATKAYIANTIADITGGTAFVKDVTWSDGKLNVDNGDGTPQAVELTGVAHEVVYDLTTLKLTIPVYGQDDIVINIPKDNFVRSGHYEAEYELPDGSTGPAIVLTVDDEESDTDEATKEIVIPAAELVKVSTGGTTSSVKVSVSEGNEVTAQVIIDPEAGNALVLTDAGLKVDISGKADKLTEDAAGHLLVGSNNGNLADSGITLLTAGDMGASSDAVPTAALVAAAITATVNAAQQAIVTKLDAITNDAGTGRLDLLEKKVDNLGGNVLGDGDPNQVIVSTKTGIARSGKSIGGETLSDQPSANTLATESAVADAISWKGIE